jgi:DNA modification methylase
MSLLGGFVAATKQDDDFLPGILVIDPVSRTIIDTHFRTALTDRFDISRVTFSKPGNSLYYQSPAYPVLEIFKPFFKVISSAYLFHNFIANYILHIVKQKGFKIRRIILMTKAPGHPGLFLLSG